MLEGQVDADRDQCRVLGHCDLSELPALWEDAHQIDVTMRIDRNGILQLCAQDTASGREAKLDIDYSHAPQAQAPDSGSGPDLLSA